MTKYCGYEIGKEVSCEQVKRLFHFLRNCYTNNELITLSQKELNMIAKNNESEWKY